MSHQEIMAHFLHHRLFKATRRAILQAGTIIGVLCGLCIWQAKKQNGPTRPI